MILRIQKIFRIRKNKAEFEKMHWKIGKIRFPEVKSLFPTMTGSSFKEWSAFSFFQRHQRRNRARHEQITLSALLQRTMALWTGFTRRRLRAKRRFAWVQQRAQRVSLVSCCAELLDPCVLGSVVLLKQGGAEAARC